MPWIPYTALQFVAILVFVLMLAHLISLLTGTPLVGRLIRQQAVGFVLFLLLQTLRAIPRTQILHRSSHKERRDTQQKPYSKSDRLLEPVPENCGRFSDKDRLTSKGIEHVR